MSLTSKAKNKLIDNINVSFDNIGVLKPTTLPQGSNLDAFLYEMFVADYLNSRAAKRRKDARTAAIKARLVPDLERNPMSPGTDADLASGEHVRVRLVVNGKGQKTDWQGVVEDLLYKHGVKPELVDRLITEHTKEERGQHIMTTSLITTD